MEFRELFAGEWEFIRLLLPLKAKTGRPRAHPNNMHTHIPKGFAMSSIVFLTALTSLEKAPLHLSTPFKSNINKPNNITVLPVLVP